MPAAYFLSVNCILSSIYITFMSSIKHLSGYPKIERILKGELLPMGSDHRQTIRRSFKDIYQNLIPREILPYLLANDVITHDDYEEVKAAEKNYSTGSAAIELLTVLPNRHTDWYKHFIKALVSGSHKDLAKTIDKDLATSEFLSIFHYNIIIYLQKKKNMCFLQLILIAVSHKIIFHFF